MAFIFADQVCLEPDTLAQECERVGIPYGEWRQVANRFHCPRDATPGMGDLLLTRRQLDAIDDTKAHELEISDKLTGTKVSLQRIHIVRAQCVTPGKPSDPNAVYHVQVADQRRFWKLFAVNQGYNASQTPADATISTDTSNAGVAWTWLGVWQDLWGKLPRDNGVADPKGAAPDFPEPLNANPSDLDYWDSTVAEALSDFLQRLGWTLCYDPLQDRYTLAVLGVAQVNLEADLDALLGVRLHDGEPVQPGLGRFPETVRVLFPKRPEAGWGRNPYFHVDVPAAETNLVLPAGVLPTGRVLLWDDKEATLSANTCTNKAGLVIQAQRRATEYFRQLFKGQEYRQVVYSGAQGSILPGSEISSVIWEERGQGVKTEVVRLPHTQRGMAQWRSPAHDERWRLVDHVWAFDSVSGVTPPTGMKPGQAEHYDVAAGVWRKLFDVWYREMNGQTPVVGRHLCRHAGYLTGRPVYIGGCCPDGSGDGPATDGGDDDDQAYPVTVRCCRPSTNLLPPVLVLTVTNASNCACETGHAWALNFNGVTKKWEGTLSVCGHSVFVTWACNDGCTYDDPPRYGSTLTWTWLDSCHLYGGSPTDTGNPDYSTPVPGICPTPVDGCSMSPLFQTFTIPVSNDCGCTGLSSSFLATITEE